MDVGDGAMGGVGEGVGGLLPALGTDGEPLGQERHEDPGLLAAIARQGVEPFEQLGPRLDAGPDRFGLTGVVLHEVLAQLLGPLGHRAREAMEGGGSLEDDLQLLERHGGDGGRVEGATKPIPQLEWRGKGPLHRHLLIEQHADEQRERISVEQLVGFGITGDGEISLHRFVILDTWLCRGLSWPERRLPCADDASLLPSAGHHRPPGDGGCHPLVRLATAAPRTCGGARGPPGGPRPEPDWCGDRDGGQPVGRLLGSGDGR